jgi:hypothetical protein
MESVLLDVLEVVTQRPLFVAMVCAQGALSIHNAKLRSREKFATMRKYAWPASRMRIAKENRNAALENALQPTMNAISVPLMPTVLQRLQSASMELALGVRITKSVQDGLQFAKTERV